LSVNTRGYDGEFVAGKRLLVVDVDVVEHEGREIVGADVGEWLRVHTSS
jgi:hypothetical protein